MGSYLIGESDIAGLNNYLIYLERYPGLIEGFLKNLGLPSLESGTQQTLVNIVTRAKRDTPVWPETSEHLHTFHRDVTLLINDVSELVTQLKLYERPEGTDPIRENLNTLALHAAPYNMNGKLGISPARKTHEITYVLMEKLTLLDNLLYNAANNMKLILHSAADVIPRTTDFMKVKIEEHEARHRKPDSSFPDAVRKQLEIANNTLQSSKTEYSSAVEAANNLHAYCIRQREILNDARGPVLQIGDKSNVRTFLLQINQLDSRFTEAMVLVNRASAVL